MNENRKPSFLSAISEFWPARELYMQLNPDGDAKLWDFYKAEYERADVGEIGFGEDIYREFFTDKPPKTVNVIRSYRNSLMDNILKDYVAQYTREELVSMCNLIARGLVEDGIHIKIALADGVAISLKDIVLQYNDTHDESEKIILSAPPHGGIV